MRPKPSRCRLLSITLLVRHPRLGITCVLLALLGSGSHLHAQSDAPSRRRPDPEAAHDPSTIVESGSALRLFCTGVGVSLMKQQPDGGWRWEARVFAQDQLPDWHKDLVPENRGHLWAPDVLAVKDEYWLYYSVSSFGKNRSAIGLAVGKAIDPASPDWRWEDRGPVIATTSADRFNAIDPAIFRDPGDDSIWMSFGSFWDGIQLIELDPKTGLRKSPDAPPIRLAWTQEIEAPFIHTRDGRYYLFVNWGKCCRGVESTYEIRVGRSAKVTGPYLDRDGKDLREGGGALVIGTADRWIGPGHASIHVHDGREQLVHHIYDKTAAGRPRVRLTPLVWDNDGWPTLTERAANP
jgi:arabinan endo-1,5-alpha-L-arabinosidase